MREGSMRGLMTSEALTAAAFAIAAFAFASAVALVLPVAVLAEGPPEVSARAAAAYKSGDYATAVREYEALRSSGIHAADLFFDLGNAYAKSGDVGHAVANFERARLREPRDRELLENLALVREQCVDHEPAGLGAPGRAVSSAVGALSPDEWALLLLVGYVVFLASIAGPYYLSLAAQFWSRLRRAAAIVAIASGVALWLWHGSNGPGQRAVVVVPEVTVRSGPDGSYLGEFTLHPGSVVRVEGERSGWVKIAFSPSLRGWTESSGLEIL